MTNKATQFKKGQSGNPKGRPRQGYSITEMMKEMLNANPDIREGIGKRIAQKALEGDMTAIAKLWAYMDGQPVQPTDLTSGGEKLEGLTVTVVKSK